MTITPTITPVTVTGPQQLGDLVRLAIASRTPIVDYGLAHERMGHTPPDNHLLLTQTAAGIPNGIIDHYDRDMTVRVAGGATLGQVQQALASTNQFVPIDADHDLTFAEIINANVYGPLRLAFGSLRDLLLGMHYIDGLGRNIQVGGRTVKNVAGLDVTRLMVGSLGELGLIHQAVLRTYAIPEQVLTVDLKIDDPAHLDTFLTGWILTDACPASVSLQRCDVQWCLRVAYYGRATACASQLRSLQAMIETLGGMHITGTASQNFETDMAQHRDRRRWQRESSAVVKILVPPAATGQAVNVLHQSNHEQGKLMLGAMPAHGCIYAGGNFSADQARALDKTITAILSQHHGVRSWINRPTGSEQDIAPFSPMPVELPLLINLKKTMDPHHLFNPGRCLVQEQSFS